MLMASVMWTDIMTAAFVRTAINALANLILKYEAQMNFLKVVCLINH